MPPTITTESGTIAVPMSSILDALEDVLSEAERKALFGQLIGLRPSGVAPGDLITAELFNDLIGNVNDLLARVAILEGAAGGPIIDSLEPGTSVAVLEKFTVVGRNFNPDPRLNLVRIGDVEINQFRADSTPTRLSFALPDMFASLPATLPVRVVTAGRTSNAVNVTVNEMSKAQKGNFVIGAAIVPAGNVTAGADLAISWPVQAVTLFEDVVNLSLVVAQPNGATASAWLSTLALQPGATMPITPAQTKTVAATMKVPAGATSVQLALQVVSQDKLVKNISDPVTVTIGQAIEASDPRIEFAFRVPSLGGGGLKEGPVEVGGGTLAGIHAKAGGAAGKLIFTATDKRTAGQTPADFTFNAQFDGPSNGLVLGALVPTSSAGVPAGQDVSFDLPLSAPAGATVGATAKLKVTCNQTKTTGGLSTYKAFRTIHVKIIS